jgi:hypothetical protein
MHLDMVGFSWGRGLDSSLLFVLLVFLSLGETWTWRGCDLDLKNMPNRNKACPQLQQVSCVAMLINELHISAGRNQLRVLSQ